MKLGTVCVRLGIALVTALPLGVMSASSVSALATVANWSSLMRTVTTSCPSSTTCFHTSAMAGPAATECQEVGNVNGILGCSADLEVTYNCAAVPPDPVNVDQDLAWIVGDGLLNFSSFPGDPQPVQVPVKVTAGHKAGEGNYTGVTTVSSGGTSIAVVVAGTFAPACSLSATNTSVTNNYFTGQML